MPNPRRTPRPQAASPSPSVPSSPSGTRRGAAPAVPTASIAPIARTARAAATAPPPREPEAPARRIREVPAVSRAVAILRFLGRSPEPVGVKAIAQALDLVPSTCLHILRVLVAEELLQVDAAKRYRLGTGMLALARSVIERNHFPAAAQPVLDRLSLEWGVTAMGVEISGLEHMVVLALSQSRIPFRLHVDVGSRFPALISATGRVVAAHASVSVAELERRYHRLRWQSAPTFERWREEVALARKRGYATDRGAYINGVTVLAVPVLNARGEVTHTLVAAGLAERLTAARCAAMAKDMQDEARRLGATLFASR